MKELEEFTIEELSEFTFRYTPVPAVDTLALAYQLDLNDFEKTRFLYNYALLHTEVLLNGKWTPCKVKTTDYINPSVLSTNLIAMNSLCMKFINEVLIAGFPKSSE